MLACFSDGGPHDLKSFFIKPGVAATACFDRGIKLANGGNIQACAKTTAAVGVAANPACMGELSGGCAYRPST